MSDVPRADGAEFTLLDGRRRGWFLHGVGVGVVAIAFGAFLGLARDGLIFGVNGGVALASSAGFLGYDGWMRRVTST